MARELVVPWSRDRMYGIRRQLYSLPRRCRAELQRESALRRAFQQCQATRHGRKFISGADPVWTEPALEDAADRRHERGAPSKEDAVDRTVIYARTAHHLCDGLLNRGEVWSNPGFEFVTGDRCVKVESVIPEGEVGLVLLREGNLGALDGLMQLVAEVRLDQLRKRGDLFRFERPNARRTKHFADGARAQKGEMMPMLESYVDPVWYRDESLVD